MKLSKSVKSISYLKANTAEAIRRVNDGAGSLVITQRGEAKAVLVDIGAYEQTQESLALLKMLAAGSRSVAEGRTKPLSRAFTDIRKLLRDSSE